MGLTLKTRFDHIKNMCFAPTLKTEELNKI